MQAPPLSSLTDVEEESGAFWRQPRRNGRHAQSLDSDATRESLSIPVDDMGVLITATTGSLCSSLSMEDHSNEPCSNLLPSSNYTTLSSVEYGDKRSGDSELDLLNEEYEVDIQLVANDDLQSVLKNRNPQSYIGEFIERMEQMAKQWLKRLQKQRFQIVEHKTGKLLEDLRHVKLGFSRSFIVEYGD